MAGAGARAGGGGGGGRGKAVAAGRGGGGGGRHAWSISCDSVSPFNSQIISVSLETQHNRSNLIDTWSFVTKHFQ